MARAQVIATVSNTSGEAYARNAAGKLRRLNAGDAVYEGESVVSSDGGQVVLHLADGRNMTVVSGEVARIDAEVGAQIKPDAGDSAVVKSKGGFDKIAKVLAGSGSLDALLDEAPTAAGAAAAESNDGHSFIQFMRLFEHMEAVRTHAFGEGHRSHSPDHVSPVSSLRDITPPALTARLDPSSDSGVKGDGITNDRTPTISGTGEPGASIRVALVTGEIVKTTVRPDGEWTVTPEKGLPNGPSVVNVTATDAAGNATRASVPLVIDTDVPNNGKAPAVEIIEDINNDGRLGKTESVGPVDIKVSFDGGSVSVGDKLRVDVNGVITEFVLTAADKRAGFVITSVPVPPDGTTLNVTAKIVDVAGNSSAEGSDSVVVDTTAPNAGVAPVVEISEDANNDGWINKAEAMGDADVRVSFNGNKVDVGDKVQITSNGVTNSVTITAADKAAGFVSTSFAPQASGTTMTVTARIVDAAGNSTAEGSASARVDTQVPNLDPKNPGASSAPLVELVEDANNDGFINKAEANGVADVKNSFNGNLVEVGDIVKITLGGVTHDVTIQTADKTAGFVTTSFPLTASGTVMTATAIIVDAAGNKSAEGTDSAKVDLSSLDGLSVSITEDSDNDGFINKTELVGTIGAEVKLPAGAISGDALTLTATGNASQTITLTQPMIDAGKVVFELTAPANGTEMVVTAQVTDPAGNASAIVSDKATIATDAAGAPVVSITEDLNNDGFINKAELNGDIGVSVSLGGTGAKAGDSLLVSVNGTAHTPVVLSAADITAGSVAISGVANPGEGATLSVSAQIKDIAGNLGATGSDSAVIDTTSYTGLAVVISEDENDDGFISLAELKDNDIDVRVTLPAGAAAGDTLTVSASGNVDQTFKLTAAQITAGHIDVAFNPTGNNTDFKVSASIIDAAGNHSGPVSDTARLQLTMPGAPEVTIVEDGNNDGYINNAELKGPIDVSVTVPATAKIGDSMLVSVNGTPLSPIVITQADIDKGSIAVSGVTNPGEGNTLTVTAQVKDSAGNLGNKGSDSAIIDTSVPNGGAAPTVVITEDANNDSFINKAEAVGDADVKVTFDGSKVAIGDTVKVTSGGVTHDVIITAADKTNGYVTTSFAPQADGSTMKVTAVIVDAARNSSAEGQDSATVDLSVPNNMSAPDVVLTEDGDNDGYINSSELNGLVDVKVSFSGPQVNVGDIVKVSSGGITHDVVISDADKKAGFVTSSFDPAPEGSKMTVTAVIVDTAGNQSAEGKDSATIDTTKYTGLTIAVTEDENNDGFISIAELKDSDIDVRVAVPAGAAVGDTLTVSGSGNIEQTFVLTAQQIANGYIDVAFNPTADNTDFVATAKIVDAAGNSAGPVSDAARLHLSAPGVPIVTIAEDSNNDGYINNAELKGVIDVSVIVPATAKVGDSMLVSVNGTPLSPIVLTLDDITKGSVAVSGVTNPGEGNTLTVTAQVKDAAGNLGETGSDSAIIDTSAPNGGVAPTVEITEDANNDGWINKAEAAGNADVKVSFDGSKVAIGDTVKITSAGVTHDVVISDADKKAGFVTTSFAQQASGTTMTVTAVIVDAARNSSAEGSDSARIDTQVPNEDPGKPTASSAPLVEITEDANNDGFINKAEA